jgi:hypothetical protein
MGPCGHCNGRLALLVIIIVIVVIGILREAIRRNRKNGGEGLKFKSAVEAMGVTYCSLLY